MADGLFAVSPSNPVITVLNRITAMSVDARETARLQFKEIKVARQDLDPPPAEKKAKLSKIDAYLAKRQQERKKREAQLSSRTAQVPMERAEK